MQLGFIISLAVHVAVLGWMLVNLHQTPKIDVPDTVTISVAIVTPSEVTRMKQGDENTKNLESKAADKPSEEDSTKEAAKPKAAPPAAAPPPPPPVEVAKAEPPPPPEPPKAEPPPPVPPPEPPKAETPPPPEPAGPTPEEQAALAAKLAAEQKAAEAKAKADAAAKAKADAAKKAKADAASKAKADAEKKKFDANKLAELINKSADDAPQKALIDKSNKPVGAKPTGTSQTATNTGPSAGTKEGRDTVLSAREADMLNSLLNSQLSACWTLPAGGGGSQTPIVALSWHLKQDGTLDGEPQILQSQNTPLFAVAAEAAVKAVKKCAPFNLPPDKYANWRDITWKFDPSKML